MKHDGNKVIFHTNKGVITYNDIVSALYRLGADQCDVLFVHSDISFGQLDPSVKRKELKELLLDALMEMNVKTLMFPTFTFSFCNKEDYDVEHSVTAMGMLPEYVRNREDAYRTDDPILSVAIIGDRSGFEKMIGRSSCGTGGIFHQLHISGKKVKFLFFGTLVTHCFTFMHYIEEIKQVPYRYARPFDGTIIQNGIQTPKTVDVYVRYKDVGATLPKDFTSYMLEHEIMKKEELGMSSISIVDERSSYEYICSLIDHDPYVFSVLPEDGELVKEYKYGNIVSM
ncbi:MAG: AAC(3) family N-acetyltransferase [Lachnospiraceae bacterium]|nr:AAC(3) family N-acetyltransferase [Lachnospiraceae bacterium]